MNTQRRISWGFRIFFVCSIAVLATLHLREADGDPGGSSAALPPQAGNPVADSDEPAKDEELTDADEASKAGDRVVSPEDLAEEKVVSE